MVAPSGDRRRCANVERASSRSRNPARLPAELAGKAGRLRAEAALMFESMPRAAAEQVVVAGREIAVSTPAKVLFPKPKYTKLDLVHYYIAVADGALRGAGGRPNVLVRYPNGISGEF